MPPLKTLSHAGLVAAVMLCGAQAALAGELRSNIELSIVELDADGEERLVERDTVKPGEVINFTMQHENLTEDALSDLVIVGPVPAGVTLQLGSQNSSHDANFEIQAEMDPEQPGLEWSALPALRKVIEEDGTVRMEPVPESTVQAVRWTLDTALDAGELALNSYRVVVN
jgi:uncharacterized repeat protein (TIGR01451 family)